MENVLIFTYTVLVSFTWDVDAAHSQWMRNWVKMVEIEIKITLDFLN